MTPMVAAVTMVKDEEDIIVPIIRQLFAQGVGHLWALDNMSSDKTRPLLERLAADHPITIIDDLEPGYYQAQKMSGLARLAAEAGADWVLPFDADEWWYGTGGTIADMLAGCDADVVKAYGFDHVPQPGDDQSEGDPARRLRWRRPTTQTFPKVCFRAHPDVFVHQGNHNVDHPGGRVVSGLLEYRHFGYRSPSQMARKVRNGKAAYEASTVHEMHGAHWRRMGAMSDLELAVEWEALLCEEGLVEDPAPLAGQAAATGGRLEVSVVIPHYGKADLTAACVLSVATHWPGVEVVVVDNGTGERFPCDILIGNEQNEGFAVACNQGAAAATHNRVLFLNNDTVVHPGSLPPLLDALAGDVAAVGAHLVYPDGTTQHAGISISRTDTGILHAENRRAGQAGPVDGVTAACMLVDREKFWEAGGFDEGYWNGYEDVDLCLTFRKHGWKVLYEPAAVVTHLESQSGPERWARVRDNIARLQAKWTEVPCG